MKLIQDYLRLHKDIAIMCFGTVIIRGFLGKNMENKKKRLRKMSTPYDENVSEAKNAESNLNIERKEEEKKLVCLETLETRPLHIQNNFQSIS